MEGPIESFFRKVSAAAHCWPVSWPTYVEDRNAAAEAINELKEQLEHSRVAREGWKELLRQETAKRIELERQVKELTASSRKVVEKTHFEYDAPAPKPVCKHEETYSHPHNGDEHCSNCHTKIWLEPKDDKKCPDCDGRGEWQHPHNGDWKRCSTCRPTPKNPLNVKIERTEDGLPTISFDRKALANMTFAELMASAGEPVELSDENRRKVAEYRRSIFKPVNQSVAEEFIGILKKLHASPEVIAAAEKAKVELEKPVCRKCEGKGSVFSWGTSDPSGEVCCGWCNGSGRS